MLIKTEIEKDVGSVFSKGRREDKLLTTETMLLAAGVLVELLLRLLDEAPTVPDGLIVKAMYPKRPPDTEPQVSEGKPGHSWLHELVEVVSDGA